MYGDEDKEKQKFLMNAWELFRFFLAEITTPSLSTIFKMTHAYAPTRRLVLFTLANG